MKMQPPRFRWLGMVALALAVGACGDDDSATKPEGNGTTGPGSLPEIPVPASPTDLLPAQSDEIMVGLSSPMERFEPMVSELRMMLDDGSMPWVAVDRHLTLACASNLPRNTSDVDAVDGTYISERPRIAHTRHWRKIKQVTLDPGTSYSQGETITYGTSTSHTESREFSQTIGVEVTAGGGWGPFSASVSASFEQTSTHGEVNSVTFEEEESTTETYTVESDPSHTRVYALWQLVDEFVIVDEDTTRIHESGTLVHARIAEINNIQFPNRDVIYQSVTAFD